MQKRILFSITSLNRGGAERWCVDLALQLKARGHTIAVIAAYDGSMGDILRNNKIPVHIVRGFYCRYDPAWWMRYFYKVHIIAPTNIISALFVGNMAARIVGLLFRIPVVATFHAQPKHEGYLRSICEYFLRLLPATTVAVSSAISIPGTKIIPNGIDTTRIADKTAYNPKTLFTILCVGRLVSVKRFDLIIEALSITKNRGLFISLTIVGDGPLYTTLMQQAQCLKIIDSIKFLGDRDAALEYHNADCFVQCSDSEGLSLALLEALCAGLPVIATGSNQQHAVITHTKTGLIVPHNSAEKIADTLEELYTSHLLQERLGKAGRKLCLEQYSIKNMAEQYDALLR